MLKAIGAENCAIKRTNRLAKANSSAQQSRPLIVELNERNDKLLVCANASKLRTFSNLNKVFINEDKKVAQRVEEKKLREERDARNEALTEIDSEGRHFGRFTDSAKVEHKFFWGIRGSELKRIYRKY